MHYCLSKLCYLCLSEHDNLQIIHCNDPASEQFYEKLKNCHFHNQTRKEILICASCLGKVENVCDFMDMCRENSRRLEGYVGTLNTHNSSVETPLCVGLVDVKNLIIIKEENADDMSVRAVIAEQDGGLFDMRPEFIAIKEESVDDEVEIKHELSDTCVDDSSDEVCEVRDDYVETKNCDLSVEDVANNSEATDVVVDGELGFSAVHIYQTERRNVRFTTAVVNFETDLSKLDFTTDPSIDKCSLCRKPLTRNTNVKRLLTLTGGRPHICFQCYRHDVDVPDYGRLPYKCSICNKIFVKRSLLIYHHRIHTDEKPYKCKYCARRFKHNSQYHCHERTHTGERPHACTMCERRFLRTTELARHMVVHSAVKMFPCTLCDKQFKWKPWLVRHMVTTHCDEHQYRCSVCEKMLGSKASMQRHMQIHTGERPYKCSVCDKSYARNELLKKHMYTQHTADK